MTGVRLENRFLQRVCARGCKCAERSRRAISPTMTRKPQHFKRGSLLPGAIHFCYARLPPREEGSNKYLPDCCLNRRAERARRRGQRRRAAQHLIAGCGSKLLRFLNDNTHATRVLSRWEQLCARCLTLPHVGWLAKVEEPAVVKCRCNCSVHIINCADLVCI